MEEPRALRDLRREAGLTQQDVADLLGLAKATYCLKENGKRRFSLNEALTLAKLFERPVEGLLFPAQRVNNQLTNAEPEGGDALAPRSSR